MRNLLISFTCIYLTGFAALAGNYPIPVVRNEDRVQKQQHLYFVPKIILDNEFPDGTYGFSKKTRSNYGGNIWHYVGFEVVIEGGRIKSTTLGPYEEGWAPANGDSWIEESVYDGSLSRSGQTIIGSKVSSEIVRVYPIQTWVDEATYFAFNDQMLHNASIEVHLSNGVCNCDCTETNLNSIHLNVSLGKISAGKAQGSLHLDVDTPDAQTCNKVTLAA